MNNPAVSLSALIAGAALDELAARQSQTDAALARAALLEREVALLSQRLDAANAKADRLGRENRALRTAAEARRAAVIAYTMQRAGIVAPPDDGDRPRSCRALLEVLRADTIRRHEEACRELAAMLARRGRVGRA